MFYKTKIKAHIRVAPEKLMANIKEGILKEVKESYTGHISKELGIVISVADVESIGEGVIVPGDSGVFYETLFSVFTFKPEIQEIIKIKVRDIADFGVFADMGPIDGMIHISQTMDDFVTFSKDKVLSGRDTKQTIKIGDICKARVVAVSFKDITNPKIGLTMRQPELGKIEMQAEDKAKA
ncbi:MAG: DNA-directed polymerase subunit [Candidatus Woesearchaeota archaeon]|nr:DNA-directed polymerase subunit [Candidatus Woesearchaeota archaeon]